MLFLGFASIVRFLDYARNDKGLDEDAGGGAVGGVAGFGGELALFHHGDADEEEEGGHGHGGEDVEVDGVEGGVHGPDTPPHHDFAEIVGVTAVLPEADIADLAGMRGAETVDLGVGDELDSRGKDADSEAE